jgi:hypothetical protein
VTAVALLRAARVTEDAVQMVAGDIRRSTIVLGLCGLLLGGAGAAEAQADGPSVRGSVGGDLRRGGQARFTLTSNHSDGWPALRTVAVILELHGAVLEEVIYDVDGTSIEVSGSRAVAGTGNVAGGRFFRVGAFGVEVGTGGDRLHLSFAARVLQAPPPGARFRFLAEDDEGETAARTVSATVEEDGDGLPVSGVILAVLAALLAGGFFGARVATHRRPRTSVYGTVARRLREGHDAAGHR